MKEGNQIVGAKNNFPPCYIPNNAITSQKGKKS
jgi:hypothetical protein